MIDMMTYDEKKAILMQCADAEREIKSYMLTVEQFRETKMQAETQKIDDMPHAKGNSTDLSDFIEKIEEMETELNKKMFKALLLKSSIIDWISTLEDSKERTTLTYKYVNGKSLGWISEKIDVVPLSYKQIKRIHRNAINHLKDFEEGTRMSPKHDDTM